MTVPLMILSSTTAPFFLRRLVVSTSWKTSVSCILSADAVDRKTPFHPRCRIRKHHTVVRGSIPAGGNGVAVGQYAASDRVFSAEDVALFGNLVGDPNPLHTQWDLDHLPALLERHPMIHPDKNAEGIISNDNHPTYSKILVHGMLVSSLFTSIFGTLIPGAVYLKQSLEFARPVFVGEKVTGTIAIERIRRWRRKGLILTCDTTVTSHSDPEDGRVRGKADVWLPNGTPSETAATQ